MIKKLIPYIIILMIDVYFIVSAAIGYSYEGSESSISYWIYNVLFFLISILIFFWDIIKKKFGLNVRNFVVLFLFLIPIIAFLFDHLLRDVSKFSSERFIFYILWCGPAILMGIYLSKNDKHKDIIHFFDILLCFINMALISTLYTSLSGNIRVGLGGETYQKAGYIFALGFGINIFLIIYGNRYERIKIFESRILKILSIIFLFLQITGVLATGARGPMILLIAYVLAFFITSRKTLSSMIKNLLLLTIIFISILILIPKLQQIPLFSSSLERIFAYISSDGIDWSGTSGRDLLYESGLKYVSESPILGYGFFRYLSVIGFTAHNIFLEVILQGGIVYLLGFIIFLVYIIKKAILMVKCDKYIYPYIVLMMYPLILLMFSGIYYNNSIFYFGISFFISYNMRNTNNTKEIL